MRRRDYRKTKEFKRLRQAMLENLELRGMAEAVYIDKVSEYMDLWARRCELRDDVSVRGLTVQDERGRISENRSVSLEIQVSRQMLSIFTALGFKPEAFSSGAGYGGDDDDL